MLMSVKPVATAVADDTEHVIESRYDLHDAYEVHVSGAGVTAQIIRQTTAGEEKAKDAKVVPNQLTVRFSVADDALPGVRELRVATPRGVSTVGQIVVAKGPIIVEEAKNDTLDQATTCSLPATLCGAIEKAEDVDYFRFSAEAGQSLVFHVLAMRLQDKIHDLQTHCDPLLTLRDANGATLDAADNTFRGDPLIAHTFKSAGDYFLEIRDTRYQGNKYWEYAIEVTDQPFVKTAFPVAVSKEESTSVTLYGWNLPESSAGHVVSSAMLRDDALLQPVLEEAVVNPIAMVVTDEPLIGETDEANDTVETAQSVSLPVGINGRTEKAGDLDYFTFEAKKGETFSFEVIAARLGSDLDSHLRILDAKGNPQQVNDDCRIGKRGYSDSLIENWTAKADGPYLIEVRDLHLRGRQDFVYFLRCIKSEPTFELFVDTDKTLLTPGTHGVAYVRINRKNGFDLPVQLHVDGLPEGVTATCGKVIKNKYQDGCIVFTATTEAMPVSSDIRIWGSAISEEVDDSLAESPIADALVYQEIYNPGGGRGHWPVSSHTVSVGQPGDIRGVKVSNNELVLKPGESIKIDVEIQRAEGFDKNISLDVALMHLNSTYGNPLPDGVAVDAANSKTLLTGGQSTGHITLKVDPKAAPAERQQFAVIANIAINFVMKATYSSEPMFVTIAEP
ncbi:MAG: pre-peptidase C-terminal domain-containing protein [Pirellulaceae bacterium]